MKLSRYAPRAAPARRSLGLLLFASLPILASAQTQLAPVVVTATREPEPLRRITADVVVIDADTIRNSSADSLEDLLRREAGLQIVRNGGPGQSSGYFIRGASTSSTTVLIDGVRIGSSTLAQADFEAINLSDVERVEVLRGPASSLYGADGIGGVVQVFTRRGSAETRVNASAAVGGYRSRLGSAGASGSIGRFDLAASVGRESSAGVSTLKPGDAFANYNPDRDGFQRNSAHLRAGYTPADGHRIGINLFETRLHSQYDDSEYVAPNFAQDATPDFRNRLVTRASSLDYRGVLTPAWTTTAQVARNLDDLQSGASEQRRYITRRTQSTWQNAVKVAADQQLVLAYEHLDERATATGFGSDVARHNDAVVLGYSGSISRASIQADVRHDNNSVYGGNTTGRLGASIEIGAGWRARALAGTTFRAPSFNDLYYPGYGVATVRPERGRSIEAGLSWNSDTAELSATLYRNRVRDLINYEPIVANCPPDPSYSFGCASNTGRATLQGATVAGSQRWGGFRLRGTLDLLDATDAATGVRLARRAAHQETLAADYAVGTWSIGASLLDVGSRPDAGVVLGGYAVVDLRASWRFMPRWKLEAKLLNAADHKVEPVRDYQGLGRQGWIGVRFDG